MKHIPIVCLVVFCLSFLSYAMNDSSNRTRPFSRLQFAIDGKKFHVDAYIVQLYDRLTLSPNGFCS